MQHLEFMLQQVVATQHIAQLQDTTSVSISHNIASVPRPNKQSQIVQHKSRSPE